MGYRVADCENKIIALQPKRSDGGGHQGKQPAVISPHPGKSRKPGGDDPPVLNTRRHTAGHMNDRIEIAVRQQLTKNLQNLFPPAVTGQPVMDKRRLHDIPCRLPEKVGSSSCPEQFIIDSAEFRRGPLPVEQLNPFPAGGHKARSQRLVRPHRTDGPGNLFR